MKNLNFATLSNRYNVGDVFVATYNKRTDEMELTIVANTNDEAMTHYNAKGVSESEAIVAYLLENVCYPEKKYDNAIKSGFNKITDNGKLGAMPSECRSTLFSKMRRAVNNAVYMIEAISDPDEMTGFKSVECVPVIISDIALTKTNLGMANKKFFEECGNAAKHAHPKKWVNMARVTMAQSNCNAIIEAVRGGDETIFDGYMPLSEWVVADSEVSEAM